MVCKPANPRDQHPSRFAGGYSVMNREALLAACALIRTEAREYIKCFEMGGYKLTPQLGIYPHIRMERSDSLLVRASSLIMSLDEHGRYFTDWGVVSPFDLEGVARVERVEGGQTVRYRQVAIIYRRKPYLELLGSLAEDSEALRQALESFTPETVVASGERFVMP